MKTKFELDVLQSPFNINNGSITIIGTEPKYAPYIKIEIEGKQVNGNKMVSACIKDVDIEKFAINILKAIKSKHLKK